jgi:peptide subunit release factor 1 (eRF1)
MLDDKLKELSGFKPATMPVLSVYLNTQSNQHGRDHFEPFLRKELKARANTYAPRSPERDSFDKDVQKIMSWLNTELRPSSNGVAIFACSGAGDFFEALQFDAPVQKNQLYVYHQPHLYTLAKLNDEYPRYAAVIADTNSARIFVFGLARTLATRSVTNPKVRSRDQGGISTAPFRSPAGWSLRRYQLHVQNYHLRHSKEVVEQLDRIVREEGVEHIILAGDEVILPILREQLSPFLAAKVVEETNLDINIPEHELLTATMATMREHDAQTDSEGVAAMIGEYRAGGLAAVGVHDVLAALANGQVDTLFLSTTLEQLHPGKEDVHEALAPAVGELPEEMDASIKIPDALVTRAEQTGAHVKFIEDPALLANVGGVGASLRYRL